MPQQMSRCFSRGTLTDPQPSRQCPTTTIQSTIFSPAPSPSPRRAIYSFNPFCTESTITSSNPSLHLHHATTTSLWSLSHALTLTPTHSLLHIPPPLTIPLTASNHPTQRSHDDSTATRLHHHTRNLRSHDPGPVGAQTSLDRGEAVVYGRGDNGRIVCVWGIVCVCY